MSDEAYWENLARLIAYTEYRGGSVIALRRTIGETDEGVPTIEGIILDAILERSVSYIVELESGVWLAPWAGDPGRTLQIRTAKRFYTEHGARTALGLARRYRDFPDAKVLAEPSSRGPAPQPQLRAAEQGATIPRTKQMGPEHSPSQDASSSPPAMVPAAGDTPETCLCGVPGCHLFGEDASELPNEAPAPEPYWDDHGVPLCDEGCCSLLSGDVCQLTGSSVETVCRPAVAEYIADERCRLDQAMAAIMHLGHSNHCAHRLAFGDGECECGGDTESRGDARTVVVDADGVHDVPGSVLSNIEEMARLSDLLRPKDSDCPSCGCVRSRVNAAGVPDHKEDCPLRDIWNAWYAAGGRL